MLLTNPTTFEIQTILSVYTQIYHKIPKNVLHCKKIEIIPSKIQVYKTLPHWDFHISWIIKSVTFLKVQKWQEKKMYKSVTYRIHSYSNAEQVSFFQKKRLPCFRPMLKTRKWLRRYNFRRVSHAVHVQYVIVVYSVYQVFDKYEFGLLKIGTKPNIAEQILIILHVQK